ASPSVNAGNNGAPGLPATDIAGGARIQNGTVDQGAYELAAQAANPSGEFTPLTPSRLLDTRDGTGRNGAVGPLNGGSSFDVQATGRGGVPATGLVGAGGCVWAL